LCSRQKHKTENDNAYTYLAYTNRDHPR